MKVYKACGQVYKWNTINSDEEFAKSVLDIIVEDQSNGYQVEVQYSSIAVDDKIVFSAIILGYVEE